MASTPAETREAARRIVETTDAFRVASDNHINYRRRAKTDDDVKRFEDEYRKANHLYCIARSDHKTGEDHTYAVARALLASHGERDAVLEEAAEAAWAVITDESAATYPEELAGHVGDAIRALKGQP